VEACVLQSSHGRGNIPECFLTAISKLQQKHVLQQFIHTKPWCITKHKKCNETDLNIYYETALGQLAARYSQVNQDHIIDTTMDYNTKQ